VSTVWERIEEARGRWNVLCHPFYEAWSAGELSREGLARYAGQYRHAVGAIATMSAQAAEAAPRRAELARHAAEEESHVELWDRFVIAIGGDREAPPNAETEECVAAWTANDGLVATLVRLYAIESGQPAISRTKREGLARFYGIDDAASTDYFRLHERRDVEHAAEARELVEEQRESGDEDRVVATAESAFRANWRLLDGVYH
jgi:pyrroloquinoline-quinone synthase